MEKYVEMVEKIPAAKIMIQASSHDGSKYVYNIEILNLFDPELQLINNKPINPSSKAN